MRTLDALFTKVDGCSSFCWGAFSWGSWPSGSPLWYCGAAASKVPGGLLDGAAAVLRLSVDE